MMLQAARRAVLRAPAAAHALPRARLLSSARALRSEGAPPPPGNDEATAKIKELEDQVQDFKVGSQQEEERR